MFATRPAVLGTSPESQMDLIKFKDKYGGS